MSCVWLANLGQAVNFKKLFVYLMNKLLKYQLVLLNNKKCAHNKQISLRTVCYDNHWH